MLRALTLFGVFACVVPALAEVSVLDATGARVALPAPARRVISLAPHATELLFAAGAGDRVVGVLAPADWPPEARRLPRVGDANAVNLEGILALKPDLVVTWPYLPALHVGRLREMGIVVYVSEPRTPAAIADDIERLGVLTGRADAAAHAAAALRARISDQRDRYVGAERVRVFYEIWNQPMYTVGGSHLITAAIELCGGSNVFAAQTLPAPQVSVESVLAAAPSAIIAGTAAGVRPGWLDAWRAWPTLPAVVQDNLFVVDADLLHRAGPRFVDGIEQLCAALDTARAHSLVQAPAR
jgi:iron complex transport system substrate-binding protein